MRDLRPLGAMQLGVGIDAALMEPIGLLHERGEFVVIHECTRCGQRRRNTAAADDDLSVLLG